MKNSAQLYLYLFAVLTVGQSLAANISPPLFVRSSLIMGDPGSEVSGLEKRQGLVTTYCPAGSIDCGGGNGCCRIGTYCLPGARCGGASCGAGSHTCSYGGCCEAGYACQGQGKPCLQMGIVDIGNTGTTSTSTYTIPGITIISSSTSTIPGATLISSSTSTIPGATLISSSTSTIPGMTLISSSTSTIPGATLVSSSTTTIPTTIKAATLGTTLGNTYTIPIKATSSITYSVPMPPSTTLGGYLNNTVSGQANSSSVAIIPIGSGNSLKPGAWLGALGAVFFSAFLYM